VKNNPHAMRGYLADWGDAFARNALAVSDLAGFKSECEHRPLGERRAFELPRVRRAVERHTIDAISWEQSVLIRNGLRWKPRLTLQSFAAYTPELLELNARCFEGSRAPEFVLVKLQTIDNRLPTMDDGLALQVIARDYEAELVENGLLLLRRNPRAEPGPPPTTLIERYVNFGETVDLRALPGRCQLLSLDIEYTAWGRLCAWIDKSPPLFIELQMASGETRRHRIVPGMMKTGVILNPLIETAEQWQGWYTGAELPRVAQVRVAFAIGQELYAQRIRMRVVQADGIVPRTAEVLRGELEYSMFDTVPTRTQGAMLEDPLQIDGQEVLQVEVPSLLVFDVPPGKHVLSGQYGVPPGAYLQGKSDGVSFRAVMRTKDSPEWSILLERFLDPKRIEADRGLMELEVPFENSTPAQVSLRTGPGPRDDTIDDVGCWTAVRISNR
jgi:hypothetical protein